MTLLLLAGGDQAAAPPPAARPSPSPRKPNLLVIVTDDMRYDDLTAMPRTRSLLVERGLAFEQAYVTTSLCSPSRASILSGRYAHNHGLLTNDPPVGGWTKFPDGAEETLGGLLKAAGYRTGLFGKYLNGYPWKAKKVGRGIDYVPPGWDDWRGLYNPTPYFGFGANDNGHASSFPDEADRYQTDIVAGMALDFLKKEQDRPFFAYFAPTAPHVPALPAPRHEKLFAGVQAPRPPSFDEEDMGDKPPWLQLLPRLGPGHVRAIDALHRNRLRSLQAVDEAVAALLDQLQGSGRLEHTYVFFLSDNGFELGEHRIERGKGAAYDEAIHVPLVVRGPGVPAGATASEIALNLDLAPTLLALAAARAPELDGVSLVPLLRGERPASWRQDFLVEAWPAGPRDLPHFAALRSAEHLYVEYESGERELYDRRADPYEMENRAAAVPSAQRDALAARLRALRGCRGAACR